jgi:hypothetical protein
MVSLGVDSPARLTGFDSTIDVIFKWTRSVDESFAMTTPPLVERRFRAGRATALSSSLGAGRPTFGSDQRAPLTIPQAYPADRSVSR